MAYADITAHAARNEDHHHARRRHRRLETRDMDVFAIIAL
jgi:hypothetical protein